MKEFFTIIKLELLQLRRDNTFKVLGLVLLLLTAYVVYSSTSVYEHSKSEHRELTDTARSKMLNQKATSPHMAGHYGHIAFKPATFLQAIDPGVTTFTGTTVRIEAHKQNKDVFAPAAGQSSLVRFGEFSFSLLLQVVVPLLIMFTCYRSVISDRLNGTLKLVLCQGISLRKLVAGKIAAYFVVFTMYLIGASLAYGIVFNILQTEPGNGVLLRIFGLLALYALYYLILISFTVYSSARAKDSSGLLAGLLAIWFVLTIIIPKAASNIGEQVAPLPTSLALAESIKAKKELGINGHDKKNTHTIAFIDSILKVYHVDSVPQLPIKIGGLLMQADEEFNNRLYDDALGHIDRTIARQNKTGALASFIDPFMAIKKLSMGIAGTDMHHHFDFTKSVEHYRRRLVSDLNAQDALKQSVFKDETGKLKSEFWENTPDFKYSPPSLRWSMEHYSHELLALILWTLLCIAVIYFFTKKISVS